MSAACRFCSAPVDKVFADLGMSPLANSYLQSDNGNEMEPFYPLRALVCERCFLVQLEEFATPRGDLQRLRLLLVLLDELARPRQALRRRDGRRASASTSRATSSSSPPTTATCCSTSTSAGSRCSASSRRRTSPRRPSSKGIPTLVKFFGEQTAAELRQGAQGGPAAGQQRARARARPQRLRRRHEADAAPSGGQITMEFPHLMRLVDENQCDTIYHEHFSYFSFITGHESVRGARAAAVRRRGAADARRLAAHLRLPRRRSASARGAGRGAAATARSRPATRHSSSTSRTSARCARRSTRSSSS